MDVNEILNLAVELQHERRWADRASEIVAKQLGKPDSEEKREATGLMRAGQEDFHGRIQQLKKLGDEAAGPIRQKFYAAAVAFHGGLDISQQLAEIAAMIGPGALPTSVVKIYKQTLAAGLRISSRELRNRIVSEEIKLAATASDTAKQIMVDLSQFTADQQAAILAEIKMAVV